MKARFLFASIALMFSGEGHGPLFAGTAGGGFLAFAAFEDPASPEAHSSDAMWGACNIGATGGPGVQLQVVDGGSSSKTLSFTLSSTGAPIAGKADTIGFASGPGKLSGDCEIIALLTKLSPGKQDWAAGGVMIRENYGAGSKFFAIGCTRGHGIQSFLRNATDAAITAQENCTDCKPPTWLKIVREGNHFTSYKSKDGRVWLQVNDFEVPMKKAVWVGVFTTSGGDQPAAQTAFSHVSALKAVIASPP